MRRRLRNNVSKVGHYSSVPIMDGIFQRENLFHSCWLSVIKHIRHTKAEVIRACGNIRGFCCLWSCESSLSQAPPSHPTNQVAQNRHRHYLLVLFSKSSEIAFEVWMNGVHSVVSGTWMVIFRT